MTKLQSVTRTRRGREQITYTLTIPKKIVDLMGWKKGDEILPIPNEGHLILRKMEARK